MERTGEMMAKRGRPSRADMAARAAAQANSAAESVQQNVEPDAPINEPRDDSPSPPSRNEPRRLAMEEVEARYMKTMGMEPEVPRGVQEEKEEKPAVETTKEEPAEGLEAEGKPADVAIPAFLDKKPEEPATPLETVRVKVDGEVFDVPKADVEAAGGVTIYQKERAAQNRLDKANKANDRANEALEQTRQTQAAIAKWIQEQAPKQPTVSDDQFIQNQIQLINFGTPEEQAKASKALREKLIVPRNDAAIVNQAVIVMQQQAAENQFVTEFSDIVHNPMLLKLIIQEKND